MLRAAVARLFVLWAAALVVAAPAMAQTFPKFTGFVVDAANVLSPETEADLTAKLSALQRDTKRQLIVATVPVPDSATPQVANPISLSATPVTYRCAPPALGNGDPS